eukprot:2309728-Rhodomonas_salina.2
MSGTVIAYQSDGGISYAAATRCLVLRLGVVLPATTVNLPPYRSTAGPTTLLQGIALRVPYEISGTERGMRYQAGNRSSVEEGEGELWTIDYDELVFESKHLLGSGTYGPVPTPRLSYPAKPKTPIGRCALKSSFRVVHTGTLCTGHSLLYMSVCDFMVLNRWVYLHQVEAAVYRKTTVAVKRILFPYLDDEEEEEEEEAAPTPRYTDRQRHRETDRQTDRDTDRQSRDT